MRSHEHTAATTSGPLGQPRGIGFGILLFIITLGIYSLYWVFKTQDEVKEHSGDGVGGVLGLVIWIVVVARQLVPDPLRDREDAPSRRARGALHGVDRALASCFRSSEAIVWFVKIQGALNRYWESKAAAPAPANEPAIA